MKIKSEEMESHSKSKNTLRKEKARRVFLEYPVWKALLVTAVPAIISMLIAGLYSFFDSLLAVNLLPNSENIRISQNLVNPLSNIMLGLALWIVLGTATRFSVSLGKRDYEEAKKIVSNGIVIGLVAGIVLSSFAWLLIKPMMIFQNNLLANPATYPPATEILNNGQKFMQILIWGFLLQIFSQFPLQLLRSDGRNISAAICSIVPIILNIILDVLFMDQHILNLGIEGASLATAISWGVGTILGVGLLIYYRKESSIKFSFKSVKFSKKLLIPVILIGLSPLARNWGNAFSTIITSKFLAGIPFPHNHVQICSDVNNTAGVCQNYDDAQKGSLALNGGIYWGYIFSGITPIMFLFIIPAFGLVQASRAVVAYNYGARNMERVIASTKGSIYYSIGYMATATVIASTLGQFLLYAFHVKNGSLVPFTDPSGGKHFIKFTHEHTDAWICIAIIFSTVSIYAVQFGAIILFQSINKPFNSLFYSLLRGVILEIPLSIIMSYIAKATDNGYVYWLLYPIGDLIGLSIALPVLIKQIKKIRKSGLEYQSYDKEKPSEVTI